MLCAIQTAELRHVDPCPGTGGTGRLAARVLPGSGDVPLDQAAGIEDLPQFAGESQTTRVLAANQGLYNGFLGAGLLWYLYLGQWPVVMFFLHCVLVAALYGAYSVNKRIFFVQGVPAIAAILAVWWLMKAV